MPSNSSKESVPGRILLDCLFEGPDNTKNPMSTTAQAHDPRRNIELEAAREVVPTVTENGDGVLAVRLTVAGTEHVAP